VTIQLVDKSAIRHLKAMQKQIPFAMARALTQSTQDLHKLQVARLQAGKTSGRPFLLRRTFLTKGIRRGARGPGGMGVIRAEKKHGDKMQAELFVGETPGSSFHQQLLEQEQGQTRRVRSGKHLVVPLKGARG
jgi:hypothetical protein